MTILSPMDAFIGEFLFLCANRAVKKRLKMRSFLRRTCFDML